jgi:hypothetical protein
MAGRLPTVFISSTFYDLRQVRADLAEFIQHQLGYNFLTSESPSFPVDPSFAIVENCRRQIEDETDLFVLIVGGRYGSVPSDSTKSVTNLEYLTAKEKGIPVFAFIARDIIAVLPLFERNPDADFSAIVDNPRLLRFVQELRGSLGVWTFTFDVAQDIINTLRTQFAYEMSRGLALSSRAREPNALQGLVGPAFRLAAERPPGWQPSLLITLIEEEFVAAKALRRDYDLGIAVGSGERITEESAIAWTSTLLSEGQRLVKATASIASETLNNALKDGEVPVIIDAARQFGRMYKETLQFVAKIRRAHVPTHCEELQLELTHLFDDYFRECDDFLPRAKLQIADAIASSLPGPIRILLSFRFEVTANDMRRLSALTEQLRARPRTVQ